MEGCLADLGKTFVEKLIDKALAELRHVFCFTCIANEFKAEKVWLESEIETLEQRAKVAAGRDNEILANAHLWKKKADKLIQEDMKTKQTCDCIWRYKKGKELANNIKEIKRLTEKGEKLENIELPRRLPDVERYSSNEYICFQSRESKYQELMDALKDENNYIIVFQGMGGTGKTTLAKEVGKELKQTKQFAHVIDTTVSFTPDVKKIQDDIAGSLGLSLDGCNDSDRPKKLWSRLTNGEKVLLILDDVWDHDPPLDFDQIGIPKRDKHRDCRVLITTRSKQILHKMDCDKMIELELLSEEEAWTMFKTYADISNSSPNNLITKGRKIAKECKQLPVAIAAIARSLKGHKHRTQEWDATLKSLKKFVSMDNVDAETAGVYKCLKFSYDYMENEQAKGLFLLSSVFPEDEEIPIEILTRLGIGTGLFGEDNGQYDDAREKVVIAKNKLIDNCLLMEVGKEHVKMHDLVREVAQWIANKEIQCVNLSNKDQKASLKRKINIKYLFCKGKDMDLFSSNYDGSKLEILMIDMERDDDCKCMEVPNSFFENIVKLRVLYFAGHDKRTMSFPHSIHSLANIRSILVDGIDLGDISVLGNLQSLETLDLVKCKINELPHEIAKLGKFKVLNLDECKITRNIDPFEVIERCSTLEELYFVDDYYHFCRKITLPKLQRYRIVHGYAGIVTRPLSKLVYFQGHDGCFFPKETFNFFMQTTEGLYLNGVNRGWRNLMPEIVPIDQGMKDLVVLSLISISQLQYLIDTTGFQVSNVLFELVVLYLRKMENLEELFKGSLPYNSLKKLEKLTINQCKMLRRLFTCKLNLCNLKSVYVEGCPLLVDLSPLLTCRNLVLLENLKIADCEGLTNINIDERREDGGNDGPMFPKLRFLDIEGCHQLESIFHFLSSRDLPVLEAIHIMQCYKLKYIFGKHQHVELNHLTEIYLYYLPNFMGIFPENSHTMSSHVNESSSTSRDGSKEQTQVDTVKCNIFSWRCISCHGNNYKHKPGSMSTTKFPSVHQDPPQNIATTSASNSTYLRLWERAQCLLVQSYFMCNLKKISLWGVLKKKSVFILSITPRMLVETLEIERCHDLEHIIVDTGDDENCGNNWGNVFPKLRTLHIEDCRKLEYIFGNYRDDYQNHTKIHFHLPTLQNLKLRSLPSFVAMCPKQYCLTFPSLKTLHILECSHNAIKYMGGFMILADSDSVSDKRITKELSESIEQQPINLRSQEIELHDLQYTMRLFLVPSNSFSLQDLTGIKIVRCEILEIVFSTSILRWLPQLVSLDIQECKELKHIIKDDRQNENLSLRTFFPKLEVLFVIKCHKLKSVIPVSVCKELPVLKALWISEADELEEIFNSNGDQEVLKTPNVKMVVLIKLPSLFHAQGIQLQTAGNRFVQDCGKLSLTNLVYTPFHIFDFGEYNTDIRTQDMCSELFRKLSCGEIGHDTSNENPSAETIEDVCVGAASGYKFTSSQTTSATILPTNSKMEKEQTASPQDMINQQNLFGENNSTVKPSQNVEEGIALTNAQIITGSTHLELASSTQELEKEQSTSQQCLINEQDLLGEINTTVKSYQGVEEEIALTHVHTTHLELANSSQVSELEKEQLTSQQDLINQQDLFGQINITF